MIVAPETEIYLLKTPLQIDELQQMDFASTTAQATYFQSCPSLALMNATYQRENDTMYVNFNIEAIRSYNYVMYKNKQYSNKWFYAFIAGMQYESNTCTAIQIKTDVFQTYMFEYELKRSYVKRETVADDTFGKHLIREDVDTGEYVLNKSKTMFAEVASTRYTQASNNLTPLIVVQCSERVGVLRENWQQTSSEVVDTNIVGSLPQGCFYYMFENLPLGEYGAGYDDFVRFRKHLDSIGKGNAIVNMFLVPKKSIFEAVSRALFMFDENGNESNFRVQCFEPSANTYGATYVTTELYARPTSFGSYTPVNNKLFTSQFNYFMVSNFAGSAVTFNWEDFVNKNTGAVATPTFDIKGVLSATTSYCIEPTNSIKSDLDSYGNKVSAEYIAGQQLPTLSWDSDYYLNWIAQNGKKIEMKQKDFLVSGVGDAFQSAGQAFSHTGSIPTALAYAGISAISTKLGYENLVDQINEEKRQADLVPNSVQGNLNAGDMGFALNSVGFGFFNYQVREDIARKVDRYLSMFGYRVNEIKTPNTKTRRYWNFLQTIDINLEGNIPQEALQELKQIYNAGITIWHDPAHFLDYNLNNAIL